MFDTKSIIPHTLGNADDEEDEEYKEQDPNITFEVRFGKLTTRSKCALPNQAAFLNGKQL
jgi:hypothetical protein